MELVVFANSPIGNPGQFFRDVVTQIYLDNIVAEVPVGGWIARHKRGRKGTRLVSQYDDAQTR